MKQIVLTLCFNQETTICTKLETLPGRYRRLGIVGIFETVLNIYKIMKNYWFWKTDKPT